MTSEFGNPVRLRRLVASAVDGPFGSRLASEHYADSGARVIRLGNIGAARFKYEPAAFVPLRYFEELRRHEVLPGDLLIAGLGDERNALGRTCMAPANLGPAIVKADCFRFRLKSMADHRFVMWFMNSSLAISSLDEVSRGATRARATPDAVMSISLTLPDLEHQRRIASFLDDQINRLDTISKFREKQQRSLRWRLVLQRTQQVQDLQDIYGSVPLRHFVTCLDGRRVPLNNTERSTRKGAVPYWGAGSIVDHIDDMLFDEELLLLGEDGAPFFDPVQDVSFVINGPSWINNHIHVLRPQPTADARFLAAVLNATDYGAHISGSTRDKLTQEAMKAIRIPAAPLEQQRRLVADLAIQESNTRRSMDLLQRNLQLLEERKQALITAAVTGQFVVTTARSVA